MQSYQCGHAHSKRVLGVRILEPDAHGKALSQPHPIERGAHFRQATVALLIGRKGCPSRALDGSSEAMSWVAQEKHVCCHAWTDGFQVCLLEIGNHIPGAY